MNLPIMTFSVIRHQDATQYQDSIVSQAQKLVWNCKFKKYVDLDADLLEQPKLANCVSSVRRVLYNSLWDDSWFLLPFSWIGGLPQKALQYNTDVHLFSTEKPEIWDIIFFQNKKYADTDRLITHMWMFISHNQVFHCRRIKNAIIEDVDEILDFYSTVGSETLVKSADERSLK